jgi:IclR family transcriptional regulator, KDG regulon repressor
MRKDTAESRLPRRGPTPPRGGALSPRAGRRDAGRIAVLDRATALLLALAQSPSPATLNEAAKHAGLSKATAFRILATLTEQGLVEQDEATSSYRLGIAPLRFAMAVLDGIPVHGVARPVMRQVCDMLNETVVLSVRDGDFRVNVDAVECTNAIGSSRRIGESRPLHFGPASRVMLAALSDEEIEAYLKRHRLTKGAGGNPAFREALWRDIRKARRTGIVSMAAEASQEALAMATAIRSPDGRPIAAIYVAIPRGRFSSRVEARCGQALQRAAAEIERALAEREQAAA